MSFLPGGGQRIEPQLLLLTPMLWRCPTPGGWLDPLQIHYPAQSYTKRFHYDQLS